MSEALQERETSPRGNRLQWSLPILLLAALVTGIAYEVGREARIDRAAHEHCRGQAVDAVEMAACTCILDREIGWHALIMFAPRSWQELWHRAARNECLAESYTRIVTERGVQAVRPLPLLRMEGSLSP